ncbi:MAG: hypothetical protein NVSMB12_03240 [Acidimicrobiales bacterium]
MGRGGMAAAGGLGVALALTACTARPPVIDHRQIEGQLAATVKEQKPDVTALVRCPSGLKARRGVSFECQLRMGADTVRYTVTISDVHGGQYDAETRPTEPVLDATVIAETVRADAAATPTPVTVGCGPHRFVQLAVNGSLACTVTAGGQTSAVAATVTDDGGDVSFAAAPAGTTAGATTRPAAPAGAGPTSTQPRPAPAPSLPGD